MKTCLLNCVLGNKILNTLGLSLMAATIPGGSYKATVPSHEMTYTCHFRNLLRSFAGHVTQGKELSKHEGKQLEKLGMDFLMMKSYDSYSYTQVLSILTDILKKSGMPQVG